MQNAIESAVKYDASGNPTNLLRASATVLQYDAAGNRVLQQQFEQGTATINITSGEAGIYNALSAFEQPLSTRQTQYTNSFDDDNRLTQTFKNGILSSTRAYNDLNQVTQYETFNDSGSRTFRQVYSYYADGTQSQTQDYNGSLSATGTNRFIYDNAGNVSTVRLLNGNGSSAGTYTYTYTYVSGNQGYQNTLIVANANGRSNTTTQVYDFRGNLVVAAVTGDDQSGTQTLRRDANGMILSKLAPYTDSGIQEQLIYQGSNLLGSFGQDKINNVMTPVDHFGVELPTVSGQYPAVTPGQYVVQNGDTLKSIAQAIYGDSSLWYVIADANSAQSGVTLVPGTVLKLPNQIFSAQNNSTTFKPYNPSEIIGNTAPALPPPPAQKCNALAAIVIAVVAVVVTVYTAGAAASAFGATFTAAGATAAGTGVAALAERGIALSLDIYGPDDESETAPAQPTVQAGGTPSGGSAT